MNDFKGQKPDKRNRDIIMPALIGAVIGGLLVAGIILGVLYGMGVIGKSTTESVGGQKVVVNDTTASSSIEAVAQVVPDSVVGIQTTVSQQSMFGQQQQGTAMGSGFIVTTDGYIVTNAHVIEGATGDITVSTNDDKTYKAKSIWSDSDLDLAVIKIDGKNLSAVTLGDSDNVKVGETVIAIGNPISLQYDRTVTSGIVSALNRSLMADNNLIAENLIQTDATINSGNSGGPLCNGSGEVIGINAYKDSQGEGIGFAIPVNIIKPVINKIVASGTFKPIVIGVQGYDAEQAQYLSDSKVDFDKGIYVYSVDNNSGAANAGIKSGDIITAINDTEINTMLQMKTVLYALKKGDTANVTVTRDGRSQTFQVEVQEGSSK
ncbi:MAG: trypsin-like peptidase domain-containing protein [Eubacteriaceae bacterium]|jgi:serine protease Do|nr:trypsin-like peptidase domain-containing protein [Eubacteriaceae bacterium]MDD4508726.1 trypsin-like peptidase domain-containing protein [Eubacteriaceae bacterium]